MKHAIASSLLGIAAIAVATAVAAQSKVTIGTSRDPNNGAQILIAEQKGFFRDAGLNAQVSYFPSGGDLMSAFIGGSIQFGSSGAIPTLTVRSRPYPLTVIAQMSDISGAQQLIVKQAVKDLDALRGKKIGVMRGTASEALYTSILKGYQFDPGSVELINMDPTDMTTAFVRGDVDAIVLWEPQATKARTLGQGKVLLSGTHGFLGGTPAEKRIYGDHAVLFTNASTLKEQPDLARAVVTALLKSNDFIQNNRVEAVAILAKAYGLKPAEMRAILDVNRYTLRLDGELVGDMDTLSAFLLANKRIRQPVQVKAMIDSSVLRAVKPDLVSLP